MLPLLSNCLKKIAVITLIYLTKGSNDFTIAINQKTIDVATKTICMHGEKTPKDPNPSGCSLSSLKSDFTYASHISVSARLSLVYRSPLETFCWHSQRRYIVSPLCHFPVLGDMSWIHLSKVHWHLVSYSLGDMMYKCQTVTKDEPNRDEATMSCFFIHRFKHVLSVPLHWGSLSLSQHLHLVLPWEVLH